MITTRDQQDMVKEALASLLGIGQKDVTPPPTSIYGHGPGGLFTLPGVDPQVYSAMVGPLSMIDMLTARPSVYTNPLFTTITGQLDDSGAEKNAVCDDAPVAGPMKACTLTAVFGRYERSTPVLELNRLGQFINRADPMDLMLMNTPIQPGGISSFPMGGSSRDVLRNETAKVMRELNVSFMRTLTRQLWVGNPVNNSAGGGYKEFPGFDILIGTGKVDAETGIACPAMDSDVKEFGYKNVDGRDGGDIVQVASYLMRYLKTNADHMGMSPVTWVIAMRQSLFWELTQVWPCSYLTYMCNFNGRSDQSQLMVNAEAQIRMRDDMRQGSYLLIDGTRFPVVIDDGIPEETNTTNGNVTSGCFASDIYVIPMTVLGGTPVTMLEYFDFRNPSIDLALADGYRQYYQVSGDGAWIVHSKPPTNWCIQWQAKIEPRLILRTPYLAGRINNVEYCPLQHEREAFPGDPYFVNGGRTNRNAYPPSWYN